MAKLPDVRSEILDGTLGVRGHDASGVFGAVGVSSRHGGGIRIFTDPTVAREELGDGPLCDLVVSALSTAATTCYAVALKGVDSPNPISPVNVIDPHSGSGSLNAGGSPRNSYSVTVAIIESGNLNEAVFQLTIDGVKQKPRSVPSAPGSYDIPGTGLTLTFDPGTPGQNQKGFMKGDSWSFSTQGPRAENEETLEAIDLLLGSSYVYEWINVAGVSDSPLWAALDAKANQAAQNHRYIHFKCQTRPPKEGETVDNWVGALTQGERGNVASPRVQVYAGWIREASPTGAIDSRPLMNMGTGMSARRAPHEPVDAVRWGPIPSALALLPEKMNSGHIVSLRDSGYTTARKYVGRKGIYITSGRLTAEETSDYTLEERRRIMDKVCRLVRDAQLHYLNDVVVLGADGSLEGIEMFKAISLAPLDEMVRQGEISKADIHIDHRQDLLATKTLKTRVKIIPLGKMSYIENEISFHNPIQAKGRAND